MKRRRKSKKAQPSQNQRNNARLEEAARELTQVRLVNDGTLQGLPRDVLGLIFSYLPTQKDALSFSLANRRLRQIHNERLIRKYGLISEPQRKEAFATQQKEIDCLLNNEANILSKNKHDPLLIACFKRLAQSKDAKLTDMTHFCFNEEILNKLNETIIRNRIDQDSYKLECSYCHLTRFPSVLLTDPTLSGYWSRLNSLFLNNNRLASLPAELGQLSELNLLNLDHNQLTTLPSEIGQLSLLNHLCISYNQFSTLPQEIGQLSSLEVLSIDHNQLIVLPSEIGQLEKLYLLQISHNQLTELPDNIKEENLFFDFVSIVIDGRSNHATKAEILATQTPPQLAQEPSPKRNRLLQQ
ncbi:MAG: hypothetical protein JSR17_10005 [Proteobacteria bacterium]|nr:hypothetical protein [Pseudomonadota bacterium]